MITWPGVNAAPDSDGTVTCGSLTVEVLTGPFTVVVNGIRVAVPDEVTAEIARVGTTQVSVAYLAGTGDIVVGFPGNGPIVVAEPGGAQIFGNSSDDDDDGIANSVDNAGAVRRPYY